MSLLLYFVFGFPSIIFLFFGMNRCEENSSTLSYLIDQYTVNQERDDDMNQKLDERLYT